MRMYTINGFFPLPYTPLSTCTYKHKRFTELYCCLITRVHNIRSGSTSQNFLPYIVEGISIKIHSFTMTIYCRSMISLCSFLNKSQRKVIINFENNCDITSLN